MQRSGFKNDPVVVSAVDDAISIIQYTPVPTPPWEEPLTHPRMRPSEEQQAKWEAYAFPSEPWGLSINLSSLYMGPTLAARIGRELTLNVTVTTLDLSMCDLGSGGCIELVKCLKKNYVLERLSLDGNRIGPLGAVALAEYIAQDRSGFRAPHPPIAVFPLEITPSPATSEVVSDASGSLSPTWAATSIFVQPNRAMNSIPYHKDWENDTVGGTIPPGGRPFQQGGARRAFVVPTSPSKHNPPSLGRRQASVASASNDNVDPKESSGGVNTAAQSTTRGLLPNLHQAKNDGVRIPPPSFLRCPLKALSISCNAVGDEGCVAIMNSVRYNSTIEFINLRANNISNLGAFAALDAIADHRLIEQQYSHHCKRVQEQSKTDKGKKKKTSVARLVSNLNDVFSPMGAESCLPPHLRFDVDSADSPYVFSSPTDQLPQQSAAARLNSNLFRSLASPELPPLRTPQLAALTSVPFDSCEKERREAISRAMVEHGFATPKEFYDYVRKATVTSGASFFEQRWQMMRVEQRNDFIKFASKFREGGDARPELSSNPITEEVCRLVTLKKSSFDLTASLRSFLEAPRGGYVRLPRHSPPSTAQTSYHTKSVASGRNSLASPNVVVDTTQPIPLPNSLAAFGGHLFPVLRSALPPGAPSVPLPRDHILASRGDVVLTEARFASGLGVLPDDRAAAVCCVGSAFDFVQERLMDVLEAAITPTIIGSGIHQSSGVDAGGGVLEIPHAHPQLELPAINHQITLAQRDALQRQAEEAAAEDYHGINSARLRYGHKVVDHASAISKLVRVPSTDSEQQGGNTDAVTEEDLATMRRVWAEAQSPRKPQSHMAYMPSCLVSKESTQATATKDLSLEPRAVQLLQAPRPPRTPKSAMATGAMPPSRPAPPSVPSTAGSVPHHHAKTSMPTELQFLFTLRGMNDSRGSNRGTAGSIPRAASPSFDSTTRQQGPARKVPSGSARPETGSDSTLTKVDAGRMVAVTESQMRDFSQELSVVLLDLMRSPLYAIVDPLTALLRGREAPRGAELTAATAAAPTSSLVTSQSEAGVAKGQREGDVPANTDDTLAPLLYSAGIFGRDAHRGVTVTPETAVTKDSAPATARLGEVTGEAKSLPSETTPPLPIIRNTSLRGLWLQVNEDIDEVLLQKLQMALYTRVPLPPAGLNKKTIRAAIERRQRAGEAIPIEYTELVMSTIGAAKGNDAGKGNAKGR